MNTLPFRMRFLGPTDVSPHHTSAGQRYIYAFWHENLLLPAFAFHRPDIAVLLSQSADGEMIAEVLRHLRMLAIRGSTTRGGVEAVRQILRRLRQLHLAITPDGPRGPRRRVKPGIAFLAARTGMPIVVGGFGYRRPWRLRSWDRFVIPRPWTPSTCVVAPPILVPPAAGKEDLERARQGIEATLHAVTDLAQLWADTGHWPPEHRLLDTTRIWLGEYRQAG
jgi:lysophospholipid acyltransferase (LPLAT)-like uncharacterized protein